MCTLPLIYSQGSTGVQSVRYKFQSKLKVSDTFLATKKQVGDTVVCIRLMHCMIVIQSKIREIYTFKTKTSNDAI